MIYLKPRLHWYLQYYRTHVHLSHLTQPPSLALPYFAAGGYSTGGHPYGHYALDARQMELEMALQQRRHHLANQLQVEEEMDCKLAKLCD